MININISKCDDSFQASAEDAFGKVEDTEIKEKYVELKNQLLTFERREAEILARESVLYLERENAQRQVGEVF